MTIGTSIGVGIGVGFNNKLCTSNVDISWLDDAFGTPLAFFDFYTPGTVDGGSTIPEWRSRTDATVKFEQSSAGLQPNKESNGARCQLGRWMQGSYSNGDDDQTVIILSKCNIAGSGNIIYGHFVYRLYLAYRSDTPKYALGAGGDYWSHAPSTETVTNATAKAWSGTWDYSTQDYRLYLGSATQDGGRVPWGGSFIRGRNDLGAGDGAYTAEDTTITAIYHLEGQVLSTARRQWAVGLMSWWAHQNGNPDYVDSLDASHPYKTTKPGRVPPS